MFKSIYNELEEIVNANKSNVVSACSAVLELILSKREEVQRAYFETFLKEVSVMEIEIEDVNSFFSPMQEENITAEQKEADRIGARIISNLIKKNVTEEEFYEELWKRLMDDVLSGDGISKTILLVRFWVEPRIPYYQLPVSCAMENEEYRQTLKKVEPQLKRAIFAIHAGLPQKTQKASVLIELAKEIEDDRAQAVFWAVVLDQESIWREQIRSNHADKSAKDKE